MSGNKIANKTTEFSTNSQQNNSETDTNEHGEEYLKKDIYLKKRQEIIDEVRLK